MFELTSDQADASMATGGYKDVARESSWIP